MKIKAIRFKNKFKLSSSAEREVKAVIIFLSIFAAGMIIGSGLMKDSAQFKFINDFTEMFKIFFNERGEQKVYEILINSLIINISFFLLAFCCGISLIGIPFLVLIPFIKGLGYGMTAGFLFYQYKMSGIGFYLLTIFPTGILCVTALIALCGSAVRMSADIISVVTSKCETDKTLLTQYIRQSAVYFIFCLFGCITDTLMSKSFLHLFIF